MSVITSKSACGSCSESSILGFDITFAFQPIVDLRTMRVVSHEALVRGPAGQGAMWALDQVHDGNRYKFDQVCRTTAIGLAKHLDMDTFLNLNFLPNAVYRPEMCIRSTLVAAQRFDFPTDRIVFEVSEAERLTDFEHLLSIFREYKRLGFKTAIDDFGAGYSGLNMLGDFQPDFLKIDIKLVRDVHLYPARQAIVRGIVAVCKDLGVTIVAEGVEQIPEARWLFDAGIDLFQGYLFAKPAFEALATPRLDIFDRAETAA